MTTRMTPKTNTPITWFDNREDKTYQPRHASINIIRDDAGYQFWQESAEFDHYDPVTYEILYEDYDLFVARILEKIEERIAAPAAKRYAAVAVFISVS